MKRYCKKCGKEIPSKMEEAHSDKYNFQPFYTNLCEDCYGKSEAKRIFIGIT